MRAIISICLAAVVFFSLTAFRQKVDNESLKIDIEGLRNSKGFVLLSLFKDGKGYPDEPEKAFKKVSIVITGKKALVDFANLPVGQYAIVVLHDENSNLKMDKNLGIPKEGYGFSNNVMGVMGPPPFSKASFKHEGKQVVQIKMRY